MENYLKGDQHGDINDQSTICDIVIHFIFTFISEMEGVS